VVSMHILLFSPYSPPFPFLPSLPCGCLAITSWLWSGGGYKQHLNSFSAAQSKFHFRGRPGQHLLLHPMVPAERIVNWVKPRGVGKLPLFVVCMAWTVYYCKPSSGVSRLYLV
jgi:hypothetical protein